MEAHPVCPYCVRAKELLKRKGFSNYQKLDIAQNPSAMKEMPTKKRRQEDSSAAIH